MFSTELYSVKQVYKSVTETTKTSETRLHFRHFCFARPCSVSHVSRVSWRSIYFFVNRIVMIL